MTPLPLAPSAADLYGLPSFGEDDEVALERAERERRALLAEPSPGVKDAAVDKLRRATP